MADVDNTGTVSLEKGIPYHSDRFGLSPDDVREIQEQCRTVRSDGDNAPDSVGKLADRVNTIQAHPNYTEPVGKELGIPTFMAYTGARKSNSGEGMGGGASFSVSPTA